MLASTEDKILQRSRMKMLAIFCIVVFFVLLARLWYLQIVKGSEMLALSEMNRTRLIRVRAPRGMIVDRNGRILATSRPQFVVMVVPELLQSNAQARKVLCRILGISSLELSQLMKRERPAAYAPVRVAVDVPLDTVTKLIERRPILPGVSVEQDQLRTYPDGALCSHILGYIGEVDKEQIDKLNQELEELHQKDERRYAAGDYAGKSGLERQYELMLHGTDGGMEIEVDALGRTRRVLQYIEPVPGNTLKLTIDKDLQIAAYRAMQGKTGAAVAINPQTGEVLAMVSKPDFDPNIFVQKLNKEDWMRIVTNRSNPLQNRAISNKYPPGSTFKPITAVAALESGVASTDTTLVCTGIGLYKRRCWKVHGRVDMTKAIAQSCDVYFYEMGRRLGINRLAPMARAFGLGNITGIDLPFEKKGTVPDEKWKMERFNEKWWPGETVICAIGQGYIQATPIQMASAAATVANWGKRFQPYIVKEVLNPNGKLANASIPKQLTPVPASQKVFEAVRFGMRQAVIGHGGTGRVVDIPGITVAGKTGSAEDPPRKRPHAWFICFAPMEKPEIAIAVISEQGGHGSTGAAPVARAILDVYFGKKKPKEVKPTVVNVVGD